MDINMQEIVCLGASVGGYVIEDDRLYRIKEKPRRGAYRRYSCISGLIETHEQRAFRLPSCAFHFEKPLRLALAATRK